VDEDTAEDGHKKGRKGRKKTVDAGNGEEAHGQQEAKPVVDDTTAVDGDKAADLLADAETAEEGRKKGRKARKKTGDAGEEAHTHGQQAWESVVDNTADLPVDAGTAEDGHKKGRKGRKKTADAGDGAEAHGQQEAKSAVDDNTADVDADTAEDGRKGRKRRKKTADAGKEAPGEEAEAHGQKE
jgi:hypothetical protein